VVAGRGFDLEHFSSEHTKCLLRETLLINFIGQSLSFKAYGKQTKAPIAIVSYEKAVRSIEEAMVLEWDLVIFDEAHRLKSPKSMTNKVCFFSGISEINKLSLK
jgi:SNF2 family DNA or RNA helicase